VILPATEPSHAVFLSRASQDQAAARRICEALRAASIEVFIDQSILSKLGASDRTHAAMIGLNRGSIQP
jgi:hypothetical protein